MVANNLDRTQLIMLPVELLSRIYQMLFSLSDALTLGATCHILHDVWTSHRNVIVDKVIANQIECYPCARQLLEIQQDGPPIDQRVLSNRDLSNLVRNARRIEEVIRAIEQNFLPRLKIDSLPKSKRTTIHEGNEPHPSKLTPTERLRVIRACYQIWSLTYRSTDVKWEMVYTLRPRELFYLVELTYLARVTKFPGHSMWETFAILKSANRALVTFYNTTYGCQRPRFPRIICIGDSGGLFIFFDHWQDNLKSLVCGRPLTDLRRDAQAKSMEHLWDYEPGDEFLIVED